MNFPLSKAFINKSILPVIFLILLPGLITGQIVKGNFRASSIEKIDGYYYIFGINDKNDIQAVIYNDKLDSIKQIAIHMNEKIGSFFGIPYVAVFFKRGVFDLRIIFKSGTVAWFTLDRNLNEINYKEYKYSQDNDMPQSEPKVYNPIYSIPSYASNFKIPKPANGFFINNYYYQFLLPGMPEFSNTITDRYTYYKGEPVIRKLELVNNSGPFYKEIKRISFSRQDFDIETYRLKFIKSENGTLYFLATKRDGSAEKGDVKLIEIKEDSLTITETDFSTPSSTNPELEMILNSKTLYDSINHRIIQIGNYASSSHSSKGGYIKQEGSYICEYNLKGIINHIKKMSYPDYNLYFTVNPQRFYEDFKDVTVEENGFSFSKDGSITIVEKNNVLTKYKSTIGDVNYINYYYTTVLVSFINIDSTFENIQAKIIIKKKPKRNSNYETIDELEDFNAGTSVNNATALFVQKEYDSAFGIRSEGQNTNNHSVYSSYYGMKYIKVGAFKTIFIYNGEHSIIFDKSKKGKFQFKLVSNVK